MADPQQNSNPDKLNKSNPIHGKQDIGFDSYKEGIIRAFADAQKSIDANYFHGGSSKKKIIKDFEEYVREKYGNSMLQDLHDGKFGKAIDVTFNEISNKGFTVADFMDKKKSGELIKRQFGHITSETEAMKEGMMDFYNERNGLSDEIKDRLPIDQFLRDVGQMKVTNQSGKVTGIEMNPHSKFPSIASIQRERREFVKRRTHDIASVDKEDVQLEDKYAKMMDFANFDPTQKIACISIIRDIHHTINKLPKGKRSDMMLLWREHFGHEALDNPVSAVRPRTTIAGIEPILESFLADAARSGHLTEKEFEEIKTIKINPELCIRYGKQSGDIAPDMAEPAGHKFSELTKEIQYMVNTFAQVDLVTHIDETISSLDTALEDYSRLFTMPGTMHDFFTQFGTPDELSPYTEDPAYIALKKEYNIHKQSAKNDLLSQKEKDTLAQTMLSLRKRMDIFERPKYDQLKGDYERIKDRLGDKNLSDDQVEQYEAQLKDIKYLMDKEVANKHGSVWEKYFDHIAEQIDQADETLGNKDKLGSKVQAILTDLKNNNWDISKLTPEGQNILMRASVNMQLMKVKRSDVSNTIGYNFEEYRSFVSQLFDMTSKQSTIITKDGEPIVLNFKSKKFTGKPYDRQTVDISDITALKNIQIEFVVDITDNSNAESFIKVLTGDERSHVIKNFFQKPGFPDTITDSSLVKIVSRDGKVYEGYLSPASFQDGTVHFPEYDDQTISANTFFLYDKPADQQHPDRQMIMQKDANGKELIDPESGGRVPVYVNMANANEWSRIDILEKNVTISEKSLNALALGYGMASSYTKEEMFGPNNDIFDHLTRGMEDDEIEKMKGSGNQDKYNEKDYYLPEKVESSGDIFEQKRNRLFPMMNMGTKEPIKCEEDLRLAISPKDDGKPIGTPPHRRFLSMLVKNVQKDKDGKVISCEFLMSNLTYGGKPTQKAKPIKINANNIDKFVDLIESNETINLGINTKESSGDPINDPAGHYDKVYNNVLSGLPHIKYNMEVFKTLGVDNKLKGLFYQKDDPKKSPITRFIATKATSELTGKKTSQRFDVEYTVEKIDNGRYKISSSGYYDDVTSIDKDGKKTKKRELVKFETTTDMTGIMLIVANKRLVPYTAQGEQERKLDGEAADVIPDIRRYRWNINEIRGFLKKQKDNIVHARQHKREQSGIDELNALIVNEHNIYRRLAEKFGSTLEIFDMDFLDHMAEEAESEGMNYGWKKIEHEYKFLTSLHHSHNYGVRPTGPKGRKGGSNFVEEYFEHAEHEYHANKGKVSYKARYRIAASLMYMLEEYKCGYARGIMDYPQGTYIKLMFGERAQKNFMDKYRKKQAEVRDNKEGNQLQEELMRMEYEYIIHNLAGGSQQDSDYTWNLDPTGEKGQTGGEDAWYFQKLYSRKYGNELRKHVDAVKNIKTLTTDEYPAKCIKAGDFDHTRNDFYKHLAEGRMEKCVGELTAMRMLANGQVQSDECAMAIMAGVMSGLFIQHLGEKTRDDLRRVCRASYGCPFVSWMEHIDAPRKMQTILNMATADKGEDSFANFKYSYKTKDHHGHETKKSAKYNPADFDCFTKDPGAQTAFIYKFQEWTSPEGNVRQRISDFIHLENINDNDDNNMMYIWKEGVLKGKNVKVYGHEVSDEGKGYVKELFDELYFNRDKGAPLAEYKWEADGFHTRTMIDAYAREVNKFDGSGSFMNSIGDPAGRYRTTLNKNIPDPSVRLGPDKKYKMSHYVDELFRTFRGVGDIAYTADQITEFYKYIRFAQQQPVGSYDRHRLIWFFLVEKAYGKGPLPLIVEQSLAKYLAFFENNLDLFDKEMADMHLYPGEAGRGTKTSNRSFGHVFTDRLDNMEYRPDHEWQALEPTKKERLYSDEIRNNRLIINGSMDQANQRIRGQGASARYTDKSKATGMTVDERIAHMQGKTKELKYNGPRASNTQGIGGIKTPPKIDKKDEISKAISRGSVKKGKEDPRAERKLTETLKGKGSGGGVGYDDEALKKKNEIQKQTTERVYNDLSPKQQKKLRQQLINDPSFKKEMLEDSSLRKEFIDSMSPSEAEEAAIVGGVI